MAEVIQLDILKALHIAKHGKYELKLNYLLDPGIPAVQRWVEEFESQPQDTLLSFDIETPYDEDGKDTSYGADDESILEKTGSYKILRISFAWKEKEALSIPFTFPYTLFVQRLMGSPNPKAGWNSGAFDIPRLEANDVEVKGEHIDGMHLWHFFKPSLPMGLKFAANFFAPEIPAWSLLNESNPAFYNAMDSDVALRAILSIRARLISEGRWDIFKRHFVDLSTCLRRMHRRGIGTDPVKREEGRVIIGERIVKTLEKIQTLVPVELKPKHVYKKSKEALQKAGIWNDSFVIVTEEYTLKENETLDSEGFVIRKLKEKPPKKPRVKKEKVEKDVSKKVGRRRKLSSDQQPTNLSLFEAPEIQHPDG
jgi:hypothetical protein